MKSSVNVLFEDAHVIAIDKPAGMLTQSDDTGRVSCEELVKDYIKEKEEKLGNVFLHVVHRLDRVTSGIVLFARRSKSLSRLNQQMRERKIKKEYIAYIEGDMDKQKGRLCNQLEKKEYKTEVVASGGKESVLDYEMIGAHALKITLTTGRYHQIRAQLSFMHHPVLGDTKYGAKPLKSADGIALHHAKMTFMHPVTKERIEVVSPPKPLAFYR